MRLLEYEVLIKKQIEEDINNPEIYNNLQAMTEIFLKRKKICRCSKDYSDMSHIIAADTYMKLIDGVKISYLLGYLEKVYRSYAHEYYEENSSEILHLDPSVDVQQPMYNNPTVYKHNCLISKVYLEEIGYVIDEVMMQSCKYDPETSAFINLKLSLILSILRGRPTSFHLNNEQEFYLKLILVNFHSKIVNEGLGFDDNKNTRY